ncbi:TPA: hypothetical protein DD449_02545 [Candidatus Berkelbacteria bacterium]|nr:hypothetical protein [Candidatus Berkelbacteria bacterium]
MEQLLSELVNLQKESELKKETRREDLVRVLSYVQSLTKKDFINLYKENDDIHYSYYYFVFDKDSEDIFFKEIFEDCSGVATKTKKINVTKRVYVKIVAHFHEILERYCKEFVDENEAADKIKKMLEVIS